MIQYELVQQSLKSSPQMWLAMSTAGCICSILVQTLRNLNQTVIGLNYFETSLADNSEATYRIDSVDSGDRT